MTGEKRNRLFSFYPYLIIVSVLLLCTAVWPMRLFGHTIYKNSSLETGIFPNLNLADGSILVGEFTPAHARLDSVSFQFLTSGSAPDGTVELSLYDNQEKKLCSVTLESGDIMNYRWIDFPLDESEEAPKPELEPGETYTWHLRAYDYDKASLALYSGSGTTAPSEAGRFYYNGSPEEKFTPAVVYTYTDKVDETTYLPYYTAFVLLGLLFYAACRKFEMTNEEA